MDMHVVLLSPCVFLLQLLDGPWHAYHTLPVSDEESFSVWE